MNIGNEEHVLQGEGISRGVVIGPAYFFSYETPMIERRSIEAKRLPEELKRFRKACTQSSKEISLLKKNLEIQGAKDAASILQAQLQFIADPLLIADVESNMRKSLHSAETVFQDVFFSYKNRFDHFEDPFFRERFKDLEDLSRRILRHLLKKESGPLGDAPQGAIVFAEEIAPSDTASVQSSSVAAFVTKQGGGTSHAAIVAKAKGIPYVTHIDFSRVCFPLTKPVIVDARLGWVILNPTRQTLTRYRKIHCELQGLSQSFMQQNCLPAQTYDGHHVRLSANLDGAAELSRLREYGVQGIGLFRSEYLYLTKRTIPSEEEQYLAYKEIVEKRGQPVVIRAFDVGGDKHTFTETHLQKNPHLGHRAIRFLLERPDIFRPQLRAILRVSALGDVSLLLPLVSALHELIEVKSMLEEEASNLKKQGVKIPDRIRLGSMIEVPGAALITEHLAAECDFLSIGTNDLVQYALAIDRSTHSMEQQYSCLHPGVLRMIEQIVLQAGNIPVSLCGEMASDPRCTALLLGLGLTEFSAAILSLPLVRYVVRRVAIVEARRLARRALSFSSARQVLQLLNEQYNRLVPEDILHNLTKQPYKN